MTNYKYILQPYKGMGTRHTCPSCHHKGEFTLYIDTSTGLPVNDSVGKCNREMNCGYHYTPSDFFKDNPNTVRCVTASRQCEPQPQPIFDYLPKKFVPTLDLIETNNLFKFMATAFGEDKAREVFALYKVGTSKHWKNDDGNSCIFPQIDASGKLRQLKVIAYNPYSGKRLHKEHLAEKITSNGYIPDMEADKVWFAGKYLLKDFDAKLSQCFFGEHLISPSKRVCIVESEKTAMIASIYMPNCTWVATGGKNGCRWTSIDVAKVLKGKKVVLYPDLKCFDDWQGKANILKSFGIDVKVSSILEKKATNREREKGLDLADFLLKQPLMSVSESTKISPIEKTPNIQSSENKQSDGIKTTGDLFRVFHELGISRERVVYNPITGSVSVLSKSRIKQQQNV